MRRAEATRTVSCAPASAVGPLPHPPPVLRNRQLLLSNPRPPLRARLAVLLTPAPKPAAMLVKTLLKTTKTRRRKLTRQGKTWAKRKARPHPRPAPSPGANPRRPPPAPRARPALPHPARCLTRLTRDPGPLRPHGPLSGCAAPGRPTPLLPVPSAAPRVPVLPGTRHWGPRSPWSL